MKCFIHNEIEAIGVCKKCGKAMCDNCSSFNEHRGICPACSRRSIAQQVKEYNKKIAVGILVFMIGNFIASFISFGAVVIFSLISGLLIAVPILKSKPLRIRLEIIDNAYSKGTKEI